ncbi:hypothetical protein [Arthrobacter sp. C152]
MKPNSNVAEFAAVGQVMLPSSLDNSAFGKALDEDIEKLRKDGAIKKILEKYGIDAAAGEPGTPSELCPSRNCTRAAQNQNPAMKRVVRQYSFDNSIPKLPLRMSSCWTSSVPEVGLELHSRP